MKGFVVASCGVSAAVATSHHSTAGFLHPDAHTALLSVSGPNCRIGHSADWYNGQCSAINAQCAARSQAAKDQYDRDLSALEAEYRRQKAILGDKEDTHAEEKEHVADQKVEVKKAKMEVKEAKVAVEENAHCPPELEEARKHLADLEAIPNETEEDVKAECAAKKKVLALEQCVVILREAEEVLYDAKADHSDEKTDLSTEKDEEDDASDAIPPQEKRVADALAAWEAAKRKGPPSEDNAGGASSCAAQIDALKAQAEQDVRDAEAEYKRQKGLLSEDKDDHAEEKEEVGEAEEDVAEQKKKVEKAKKTVKESDHCPAELSDASKELAALEAKPNLVPEDVEAECALRKKILELEQCVVDLRKAEAVLSEEHIEYGDEKEDLSEEEGEAAHAGKQVVSREEKVKCAKEALDFAKAALAAIKACGGSSAPAPAPAAPPARESGASRFGGNALVALGLAMLCASTSA